MRATKVTEAETAGSLLERIEDLDREYLRLEDRQQMQESMDYLDGMATNVMHLREMDEEPMEPLPENGEDGILLELVRLHIDIWVGWRKFSERDRTNLYENLDMMHNDWMLQFEGRPRVYTPEARA